MRRQVERKKVKNEFVITRDSEIINIILSDL